MRRPSLQRRMTPCSNPKWYMDGFAKSIFVGNASIVLEAESRAPCLSSALLMHVEPLHNFGWPRRSGKCRSCSGEKQSWKAAGSDSSNKKKSSGNRTSDGDAVCGVHLETHACRRLINKPSHNESYSNIYIYNFYNNKMSLRCLRFY